LSGGGSTNTTPGGGTSSGGGTISGTVGGGTSGGTSSSGGGGSGGGSNNGNGGGSVLGASTGPSSSSVSSDGTALEPGRGLAIDYGTGSTSPTDTTPSQTPAENSTDYSSANTAAVAGGVANFSPMTWFWIILLALLLIGTIIYIYNRNKEGTPGRLR
jgi:hypothetical protein